MVMDWNAFAETIGYRDEEKMLRDMYYNHGLSLNEIADKLGVGKATIRGRMGMYDMQRRKRGGPNNQSLKRVALHLMDQRRVRSESIVEVAKAVSAHPSTVWKYLNTKEEE
jgi:AcrR family transcriptional regulator